MMLRNQCQTRYTTFGAYQSRNPVTLLPRPLIAPPVQPLIRDSHHRSQFVVLKYVEKLPRIHTARPAAHITAMQFSSKSFRATLPNSIAAKYRKALQKHPFALFGLPFLATIVAGSFMLTPATALRYERYDRKNQQITQEEAMGLGQNRRKVNMKDEYYVSGALHQEYGRSCGCLHSF
jgi:cytochrome c oxidase assembly protein subunit 16